MTELQLGITAQLTKRRRRGTVVIPGLYLKWPPTQD